MGQNQVVRLFASLPAPRSAIIVYFTSILRLCGGDGSGVI